MSNFETSTPDAGYILKEPASGKTVPKLPVLEQFQICITTPPGAH
jgi:hypothetical protein